MDIIKKYKKHKIVSNIWIISISLVLALAINFYVINNNWITNNIKISILDFENKQNKTDIYIEKNQSSISVKTRNMMRDVTSINFSLVYNPENLEIKKVKQKPNTNISNIWNTAWINTIIIEYNDKKNIKPKEEILNIDINKKNKNTENINIISANFTDKSGNTFELQASWTIY